MKGMVFVELLQMAEELLGEDVVDDVLDRCDLSTGGAYNAVGNYPCSELMTLVQAFSSHVGTPVPELQRRFGHWMHARFVKSYPGFFTDKPDALSMFESIEDEVHVEVRKLYPDVELPRFETERIADQALRLTYRSSRPLSDFCHGLVEACLDHYGQPAQVARRDLSGGGESVAEFTVRLGG
ncbi:MAG: heme NO-binding domain-containing protein [Rhodobacterales bacterium]|nr:heme NO-binding domain-containing protein [Rhodobacterales bacterium]